MRRKKDGQIRRKNVAEGGVLETPREMTPTRSPVRIVRRIIEIKGREDIVKDRRRRQMLDPSFPYRVAKLPTTTRICHADMV